MLGAHPLGRASLRLLGDQLVHPHVARRREADRACGTPIHDYIADAFAAAQTQRLVDDGLERKVLAATHLLVGGDHCDRAGVDDALLQRLRREPAENHRVRGADARARLHRDHAFDRHRHVDDDAIALFDAERSQPVGESAHACVQLAIGDTRHRAVVSLEQDRDFFGAAILEIAIEAVVGNIELTVFEPFVERRTGLVERSRKRLVPHQLAPGELGPEPGVVFRRGGVELVELRPGNVGAHGKVPRRFEYARLVRNRLDIGHVEASPG